MDSDRNALYRGKVPADAARARFMQLARLAGAKVIDTTPVFGAQWAQSPLGFDVGPYDGHLNALGVKLITKAAADAIHQP